MNCEQARWLEFETEEARAHAAGCGECREWMEDSAALRGLADDMVPVRRRRGARWPWMLAVAAAVLMMAVLPWRAEVDIEGPPMPVVAVARPVLPVAEVRPAPVVAVARRKAAEPELYLKIETSDPDVVIYWTVEGGEE